MKCRRIAYMVAVSIAASRFVASAEPLTDSPPERPITAEERDHWAYRPLAPAIPPNVPDAEWNSHPIDRFLKAEMQQGSVEPLPRAGKATLLRRLSFDLTGLPPTVKQLAEFLNDSSPETYQKLVDRLLGSPAYGERWAQHWLDLARFAETDGFEHDLVRPNAWRYRDWIIDALNKDVPFNEFVQLQLAGDELFPNDPNAAIATGFLLCGPDMPDLNLPEERRHLVLNEITATVGAVFLGMQFGCAQCHDHKFDPIRQQDFYRLRAFFESADIFRDHPIPTAEQLTLRQAAEAAADPKDQQREQRRQSLEDLGRKLFREKNPDEQPKLKQLLAELPEADREEHANLVKQLRQATRLPELPLGRVVRDGPSRDGHLYLRGDFRQPGRVMACGFPQVLTTIATADSHLPEHSRQQLADWLTKQPLLSRVMANRLWQWHFGVGLSASASDFGIMGVEPTNPQLLDWLAQRLIDDGWSMKTMHRLLVTSRAYQSASGPFDAEWSVDETKSAKAVWERSHVRDPENKMNWHRRRQRLEGEAIRDAMLAASGQLSNRRGGAGVRPPLSPEETSTLLKDQWTVTGDSEDHRRRSVYLFVRRNLRYPMFDVFDRPDTNASCALRHESTTATQSLVLLNSRFSLDCARSLAETVAALEQGQPARQLEEAYLRVFNRPATPDEVRLGQAFLDRQRKLLEAEQQRNESLRTPEGTASVANPSNLASLVDFCLALFNANEFIYLD